MTAARKPTTSSLSDFSTDGLLVYEYDGIPCRRLTADSRAVKPGDLFLAFPGAHADGRSFIDGAIHAGAVGVLWEPDGFVWSEAWSIPNRSVAGLRARVSGLAGEFYGFPSRHMRVVGVTGTNGKTTCSHWLAAVLNACGSPTTVVGTLGEGFSGRLRETGHTTPDPIGLQAMLARHRDEGAHHCVMEVSSHALDQGRVSGVAFHGALFTNLTRDHLDYHGSMEAYGAAKIRLFDNPGLAYAVINLDDGFAGRLLTVLQSVQVPVLGYSLEEKPGPVPGLEVIRLQQETGNGLGGKMLRVISPWGAMEIETAPLGRFNLSNLLAVAGAGLLEELPPAALAKALSALQAPPGRMQGWGGGDLPNVVVDFAHTPDALGQVLLALRPAVAERGRLWVILGCGGERDVGKRPLMGQMAEQRADYVVLTSDNPRNEDPQEIIRQIRAGMTHAPCLEEVDRGEAIRQVLARAAAGDVVVIAGKGHETVQELADGVSVPWSDGAAVEAWIRERRA